MLMLAKLMESKALKMLPYSHIHATRSAVRLQRGAERADGPDVGAAGMWVADLGGEELQEAVGSAVPGGINQGKGFESREADKLVHGFSFSSLHSDEVRSEPLKSPRTQRTAARLRRGLGREPIPLSEVVL